MMGMLLPEDHEYLWIAEESLLAPLPEGVFESALSSNEKLVGDLGIPCSRSAKNMDLLYYTCSLQYK